MSGASHNTGLTRSPTSSLSGVERVAYAIWYRSKARLKDALARKDPRAPRNSSQGREFPPEIVEMIIAHLVYDIPTLKACAATSFSWYNVAFPHLHHTMIFRNPSSGAQSPLLNMLSSAHSLGLLPYVKKAQFHNESPKTRFIDSSIFDSRNMRYFRALTNLQYIAFKDLDFYSFAFLGFQKHFGHFSPTLRSVALITPRGSCRRILDFLRVFPKLDDIKICGYRHEGRDHGSFDGFLTPIGGGLRGELYLKNFNDEGLLRDIIVAFGGMRFTSMYLESVDGVPLLLKACADTLETVRVHPRAELDYPASPFFDLSYNTVLRSLEVPLRLAGHDRMVKLQSTITSPVFSEVVVVFSEEVVIFPRNLLADVLRRMYENKEVGVVFCAEKSEKSRQPTVQRLKSHTRDAVEDLERIYGFLACPPLVCSRPVSSFDYSLSKFVPPTRFRV